MITDTKLAYVSMLQNHTIRQLIGFQQLITYWFPRKNFIKNAKNIFLVTNAVVYLPCNKSIEYMTTIRILVRNAITNEVLIDNSDSPVRIYDYSFEIMERNANAFSEMYPDCTVSFYADTKPHASFILLPALNQQIDEKRLDLGLMTWDEYVAKWYGGGEAAHDARQLSMEQGI